MSDEPIVFKPLTPEDVSDEALLPKRFDFLAGEVRELLDVLRRQVVPQLARLGERLDQLEDDARDVRGRLTSLENRISALASVP